jgi:hypothetical protein
MAMELAPVPLTRAEEENAWAAVAAAADHGRGIALRSVNLNSEIDMQEVYDALAVKGPGPKSRLRAYMQGLQRQAQQQQQRWYKAAVPAVIDSQRASQAVLFPRPLDVKHNAKPEEKAKKSTTMSLKGPNFSKEEELSLIATIEERLPRAADQWRGMVAAHHENGWPIRAYGSLRKKFQKLVKASSKLPTGDIPESLREARRVHRILRAPSVKRPATGMEVEKAAEARPASIIQVERVP